MDPRSTLLVEDVVSDLLQPRKLRSQMSESLALAVLMDPRSTLLVEDVISDLLQSSILLISNCAFGCLGDAAVQDPALGVNYYLLWYPGHERAFLAVLRSNGVGSRVRR
jgi:hypothetical protein